MVELLVVILIVTMLAALSFAVTQSMRMSALKVTDMSNLRGLSSATMAAGTDSGGALPNLHPPATNFP